MVYVCVCVCVLLCDAAQVALFVIDACCAGEPRSDVLRLLRDHVRYVDRVWQLAASAVAYLRPFTYSALHIRRNEFQFKQTRLAPEASLANVRALLMRGQRVYMATDEVAPAFFAAWRADFRVVSWRDLIAPGGPLHGMAVRTASLGP